MVANRIGCKFCLNHRRIVGKEKFVSIGYKPEFWKEWITK